MWILGNGESRIEVNIDNLSGDKIGCNAVHRDYSVDHLVCVDRRMMNEVIEAKTNLSTQIYTRQDWYSTYKKYGNINQVPKLPYKGTQRWDDPFQWGSGPYAVLLGAQETDKEVFLLGFDLYSNFKTVNNIYKDTNNYDPSNKRPVDPRYWIHQIGMVFKFYPKIKFTIFQTDKWTLPETWKFSNVSLDKISNI